MKINPNTYYKISYNDNYNILYTNNEWIYKIAYKYKDKPLLKYDEKFKWGTINEWQEMIDKHSYNIEEISKEEVFLELL